MRATIFHSEFSMVISSLLHNADGCNMTTLCNKLYLKTYFSEVNYLRKCNQRNFSVQLAIWSKEFVSGEPNPSQGNVQYIYLLHYGLCDVDGSDITTLFASSYFKNLTFGSLLLEELGIKNPSSS